MTSMVPPSFAIRFLLLGPPEKQYLYVGDSHANEAENNIVRTYIAILLNAENTIVIYNINRTCFKLNSMEKEIS